MMIRCMVLILALALAGCKSNSIVKDIEPIKANNVYDPQNKEQFIFKSKAENLWKYGYSDFCTDTSKTFCNFSLDYNKYTGMKGYFADEEPAKVTSSRKFWRVILENGESFYFVSGRTKFHPRDTHIEPFGIQKLKAVKSDKNKLDSSDASQVKIYRPDGHDQFILSKYSKNYMYFCKKLFCTTELDREKYKGMKGYFETKTPTKNFAGFDLWPIILENGEKFNYLTEREKYDKLSGVFSLEENSKLENYQEEPLVQGSSIRLTSKYFEYGKAHFTTSDGRVVSEVNLSLIRELASRFNNSEAAISLLVDMDIEKDEVENLYIISASNSSYLKSKVGFILVVSRTSVWLKSILFYAEKNWIFASSYKIAADDFRWQSGEVRFSRNAESHVVFETAELVVNTETLNAFKKLANANNSILRLQGSKGNFDINLTDKDKQDIKQVYSFFEIVK
ncbi:hypothetical protein [Pseudoalteromonas sp.]|uniref:hypothetical protein n=1 Tax=Pseudoalteromonas sp. TaxID=53249 RepID=UPI003F94BBA3